MSTSGPGPVFSTPNYRSPRTSPRSSSDAEPFPDADGISVQRTTTEPQCPDHATIRRRATNATTAYKAFDEFDSNETNWPGWRPGAEPGFDPAQADGGHGEVSTLSAPCEITVVDFSQEDLRVRRFDNAAFIEFLAEPGPRWATCRWVNVNGVSWDVIQALGRHKNLHKLAIEDIMNTMNRTKCDWYPNHAFLVFTLQKLVHLFDPDASDSDSSDSSDSDSDSDSDASSTNTSKGLGSIPGRIKNLFRRAPSSLKNVSRGERGSRRSVGRDGTREKERRRERERERHRARRPKGSPYIASTQSSTRLVPMRSLQRFRASGNEARSEFMEAHSSLAPKGLAVSAEQVSVFLTADNTVISFFELSADDVERPIVKRLSTPGTVLRQSCDASMVVQAIIDAVIDLAVPLTSVYSDVIGDLELDVLTSPSVKQSRNLYIIISEVNKMLSLLSPMNNLVSVLRDHMTELSQEAAVHALRNNGTGVIVTPMTHTYLGDVLDQVMVVAEALHQTKQAADNLINLIFNTITASQNESMTQLTTATIVFLPLTFLTGYFGMNFEPFYELDRGTPFFWILAVPTVVATILVLMRNLLYTWGLRLTQRHRIVNARRTKEKKRKKAARRRRRREAEEQEEAAKKESV